MDHGARADKRRRPKQVELVRMQKVVDHRRRQREEPLSRASTIDALGFGTLA